MHEETEQPPDNKWRKYALKIWNGDTGDDYVYCTEEDTFYIYRDGVWGKILEIDLIGRITESSLKKEINKYPLPTIRQIVDFLRILSRRPLKEFNSNGVLNLKNGLIEPWEGVIRPHKSEFLSTIRLDYEYDINAKCELWIHTIKGILEEDKDKIDTLQEFFGYCLTRDTRMEKALLLIGESRSGKSTILNTLQFLVGDDNCSHVPLKNLNNPQYTGMMVNKLINIDSDVSKTAKDFEEEFKIIVTGHEVNVNAKYIAPFKFRPYCKIVMAANIFPRISDHSSAFYNRLIMIPCNRVFLPNEQNKNLRSELLEELPGIFNWAIEGLKRLNERGRFEEKGFQLEAVEELREESNPVDGFFKEHIIVDMGSEIEKGFLHKKYLEWAKLTKNYELNSATFSKCVYRKYCKQTPKNTESSITGKRVWRNLKYIEPDNPVQDKGWQE